MKPYIEKLTKAGFTCVDIYCPFASECNTTNSKTKPSEYDIILHYYDWNSPDESDTAATAATYSTTAHAAAADATTSTP